MGARRPEANLIHEIRRKLPRGASKMGCVHELGKETTSSADTIAELESELGYTFQDRSVLLKALTHRSYVNEHENEGLQHNESMEFLGDAALGFLISSQIYRRFPNLTEGELSKIKAHLVSATMLLRLAEKIRLGQFLRLSHGEEKTGGRKKRAILVDTYEAVVAAIYLDGGIEACSRFVHGQIEDVMEKLDVGQFTYGDFKSALQEELHNLGRPEPVYRVVDEIGPDHRKTFVVQVLVHGDVVAEASGRTKKEAQQEAARLALEGLRQ
jgi:ribonuclease-3